jgi:DNA-directed RNA polymerase specialized sigma24 family protein
LRVDNAAGSVTQWLGLLKAGEPDAAQALWEAYYHRLVALARKQLQGTPRRAADEEDVALSAFDSFCHGVEQGRFPRLDDRGDLWQLLVMLTDRKARQLTRFECREKRGGGKVLNEGNLAEVDESGEALGLASVIGREPTPAFAAEVAEECRRLLDTLPDAELRSIALWKMEGWTTEEIADKLKCVPRTVERRLRLIRRLWSREDQT